MINILNPRERPFGGLSNHAHFPMRIDGKNWNTVTNYVLSNMLSTPTYRKAMSSMAIKQRARTYDVTEEVSKRILAQEKRLGHALDQDQQATIFRIVNTDKQLSKMEINDVFNMYLGMEHIDNIRRILTSVYSSRIKNSPNLQSLLVSSGSRPILYISDNDILGLGNSGSGMNLVGQILMQIRHNLIQQRLRPGQTTSKDKQNVFEAYIAREILAYEMRNFKDIKQYLGKSYSDIVKMFQKERDLSIDQTYTLLEILPSMIDEINTKFNRGDFEDIRMELEVPGSLAIIMRRREIERMASEGIKARKALVYNRYVKYTVSRNRPDLTDEQLTRIALESVSDAPSLEVYNTMIERVYSLYIAGQLSKRLSDQIDAEIETIQVPSREEIDEVRRTGGIGTPREKSEESKEDEVESNESDEISRQFRNTRSHKHEPPSLPVIQEDPDNEIRIFANLDDNNLELIPFSPMYSTPNEPSIVYEITRALLARDIGPKKAQEVLEQSNNHEETYRQIHITIVNTRFIDLLRKALEAKFSQIGSLANLLRMTGNDLLVWNDKKDSFFGIGPDGKGVNHVGLILMEIRDSLNKNAKPENISTLDQMDSFILNDSFIKSWIEMRMRDMGNSVAMAREMLYNSSSKLEEEINEDFVNNVLGNIYNYASINNNFTNVATPPYIIDMVSRFKNHGFIPSQDWNGMISSANAELVKVERSSSKDMDEISKRHRREWQEMLIRVNQPKNSPDVIERKMSKLRVQMADAREMSDSGMDILDYLKAFEERYNSIHAPAMSLEERKREMEKLGERHTLEIQEVIGNSRERELSKEKLAEDAQRERDIITRISKYEQSQREERRHHRFVIEKVAVIYWSKIVIMLSYLATTLQKNAVEAGRELTQNDIRTVIARLELANSVNPVCVQIIDDELDNCILSALLNLLTGIFTFKRIYVKEAGLGTEDVRLAGSIIINDELNDFVDRGGEEDTEMDKLQSLLNNLVPEEETEAVGDDFNDGYEEDDAEGDINDIAGAIDEVDEDDDAGLFAFRTEDSESVISNKLYEITDNLERNLAKYVIRVIKAIRNKQIPANVKMNRIGYFSTSR